MSRSGLALTIGFAAEAVRESAPLVHCVAPRAATAVVADGREANRQFWAAFFTGLPDLTVTLEDLVVGGDRVVGRFVYRGTHTGAFMGIPASGNPVEMRSIDIWRVEDGEFVEHWDELNLLEVFQQVGVIPPLGS